MWQTKYASAVTKNLELGDDFQTCSEGDRYPHWVRGMWYEPNMK